MPASRTRPILSPRRAPLTRNPDAALREPARRFIESLAGGILTDPRNARLRADLCEPQDAGAFFRELQWTFARTAVLLMAHARGVLGSAGHEQDPLTALLAPLQPGDASASLWSRWNDACWFLSGSPPSPPDASLLPALNCALFDPALTPLLNEVDMSDAAFIAAWRVLCPPPGDDSLDWRALVPSHIGSAYESLLGLHPAHASGERLCTLEPRRRSARSGAGAFYTPPALVNHWLDESLEPLVREALAPCTNPAQRRDAILALRICDPACGCGNFLVPAAHRLAHHLLAVAPGDFVDKPAALRAVIEHCIHGVDLDPLAVELARAALWLTLAQPDASPRLPAAHLVCGDALVGAEARLVEGGIPDQAIQARSREDAVAVARRANRTQRHELDQMDLRFDSTALTRAVFDTWCAAFFAHPAGPAARFITNADLARAAAPALPATTASDSALAGVVQRLAAEHRFLHWELAFPIVFGDPCPGFDLVIGNPPFLNQLETATATSRARAALLNIRTEGQIKRYADEASAFLAVCFRLLKPRDGARLAFVQPQSVLSASDIIPLRRALLESAVIDSLWLSGGRMFADASVHTCAIVLTRTARAQCTPHCTVGPDFDPLPPVSLAREHLRAQDAWSELAAPAFGVPSVKLTAPRTLADVALATADFRDQYYGLEGHIVESCALPPDRQLDWQSFPLIITSGLIDLAACHWSRTPTRLLRRLWQAPRLDRRNMETHGDLSAWVHARLVPKILLATQTRVIEAYVDEHARLLPSVPVITITPRDPTMLWRVAAALASPVATADAARRYAGSGLHHHAIKLSARQALTLPIPSDDSAWREAADTFRSLQTLPPDAADRPGALRLFAEASCRGFALQASSALVGWWLERQGLLP